MRYNGHACSYNYSNHTINVEQLKLIRADDIHVVYAKTFMQLLNFRVHVTLSLM